MYAAGYFEALASEKKKGKIEPVVGQIYTFRQLSTLALLDSPGLDFRLKGIWTSIQDSHVSDEEMLSVPGMADSYWRYLRTSFEWVPSFEWAGSINRTPLTDLVDIRRVWDRYAGDGGKEVLWVTPKGHPRAFCHNCEDRGCSECRKPSGRNSIRGGRA